MKTTDRITHLQNGIETRNFVVKKETRVLDSGPLNSALCQPLTQGYCVALTVCRAVPCSLPQLIVALIRPLSRQGRADRDSNTEALHGVTISLPCQDDADKKYWKLQI